jgi:hypothetical protein
MRQRNLNRWWHSLAPWLTLVAIYVAPVRAQTWDNLVQTIRKRFPTVRQLSTQALATWLADTNQPQPLLVEF